MHDIQNREDIELLVNEFYKKVKVDDFIGHFFMEVVQIDWNKHIPLLCDFWESMLLGGNNFQGNPMGKHILLSKKEPLKPEHFDRWLTLWDRNLKEHFSGAKADEALQRAKNIAALMSHNVQSSGIR